MTTATNGDLRQYIQFLLPHDHFRVSASYKASLHAGKSKPKNFGVYFSIMLAYYFIWCGVLDSSNVLQSYSITSILISTLF